MPSVVTAHDLRYVQPAMAGCLSGAPGIDAHEGFLLVTPRGRNQARYMKNMMLHELNFSVGPAGTGKTYLAVARAVDAFNEGLVKSLILVRPAVEAGEHLGFLPGSVAEKIDPYLRPLYDALYDFLGYARVNHLSEEGTIEVAPLAYMRGRSLNRAFIILDEAQNATHEQMKMFLTRIGYGSYAVVTGDITQIDLPAHRPSGLVHALSVLKDVPDIGFTFFSERDVTRHALVQSIIRAYEKAEKARA